MPSNSYAILRQAIIDKQQVTCTYQSFHREICPHVIGMKNGREKVLSFQFAGDSSRGLPPHGEWRCMFVDQVQDAMARQGPWHTGGSHTQPQTCVDDVDVEVDY